MEFFTEVTALAALAVVAVQQILKLNIIPVYFANRFPLLTNVLLSTIASVVVTWNTALQLVGWTEWVAYIATISVLAAITYNMTLRNSETVQSISRKGSTTNLHY